MKDEYYDAWFPQKRRLDRVERPRKFKVRQVWWCQVGVNIGSEIFGKGNTFTRPVLIIRKYSKTTFLGAPLSTSKISRPELHFQTSVDDEQGIVRLDQLRTFDARRLKGQPLARIHENEFELIKQMLKDSI